ncbi:MAG TPA: serine/threonine-protein kinase [Solirubrobacteraceae bacterium]|jgi:serine/threonine protein kinase|nr:serine/threonine-protein kinase [Solirubrobacteraceae bacterium]
MQDVLKRVGRFDLLEVIGRGGAAVVYLALQRDLQRHVALKELAPFHLADTSFAERFVEESRLAGSMNHANIVTVHEFFEDGSVPYIAMEYLPHGSLRQYIGRLSMAQIAGVLEGVLAGLSHGEAHQIVHRDLKPENLLVALDGRVKIADFGVARAYSKASTRAVVTVAGTTIGTPAYMSPEQALGTDLTPATDLYSLGVVAWELLTGQVPFDETDTPVAVLYRHVHEPVPSVRSVAPDVDEGIAEWLEKMLAKRPEDRFQSADEAWVALEDVVLDLLGPRWRREARLRLDDETSRAKRTLTPASFRSVTVDTPSSETGEASGDEASAGRTPVPQTISGPAVQTPPPTVAPARRRERSNTTMFRLARRHRDVADDEGPLSPDVMRRRVIAVAIVVAMIVAAVVGVVLASSSGKPVRHGPTRAQIRAAQQRAAAATQKAAATAAANKQIDGILTGLVLTRNRNLTRLLNEGTPTKQVRDATTVRKAYVAAVQKVTPLESKTTSAAPLAKTLTTIANDYGRLVAAGRANKPAAWTRAFNTVKSDETVLQGQVGKL